MATKSVCKIDDCGKPAANGRGWCNGHYLRWHRHGDPLGGSTSRGAVNRYINEVVLVYTGAECLIWPFARNTHGRAVVKNSDGTSVVSRLVCEVINGPPPSPLHDAAHECGQGHEGCVAPGHLTWKTKSENEHDRVRHGTSNRGERCGAAKLSEAQVRQIRKMSGTLTQMEIADMFGVSRRCIGHIVRRVNWAWLD